MENLAHMCIGSRPHSTLVQRDEIIETNARQLYLVVVSLAVQKDSEFL